jgi:hypothetical protein
MRSVSVAATGACDATIRVGAYGRLMAGSLVDTMWGLLVPALDGGIA